MKEIKQYVDDKTHDETNIILGKLYLRMDEHETQIEKKLNKVDSISESVIRMETKQKEISKNKEIFIDTIRIDRENHRKDIKEIKTELLKSLQDIKEISNSKYDNLFKWGSVVAGSIIVAGIFLFNLSQYSDEKLENRIAVLERKQNYAQSNE